MALQRAILRAGGWVALWIVGALLFTPGFVASQEGDGADVAVGAVLGAYSGSLLGLMGGLEPCNRTLRGARCARVSAAVGGAIGVVSGSLVGSRAPGGLDDRLQGAAVGSVVGAVIGYGLKVGVRQYDWPDVGATAALGAAVGSAPEGAGLGFAIGAAVGSLLWLTVPDIGAPDAVALGLAGLALGGLADWVVGAARAGDGPGTIVLPMQIRF